MQKFLFLVLAALIALPVTATAASNEEAMMAELQEQIAELSEELEYLNDRLNDAERHAVLDRIEFSGDVRYRANNLSYKDVTFNPGITVDFADFFLKAEEGVMEAVGVTGFDADLGSFDPFFDPDNPTTPLEEMFADVASGDPAAYAGLQANFYNDFFTKVAAGASGIDAGLGIIDDPAFGNALMNGDPLPGPTTQLEELFYNIQNDNPSGYASLLASFGTWMGAGSPSAAPVGAFRLTDAPSRYDIDNDLAQFSRLRLNMKAKVWDNIKFSGRLTMHKNWGDSTGAQVFDSWNRFTMDATNSGNTTDDLLHVDRAYFNWTNIGDTGFYASIGRRPSTYGPPTQFRENELRGGTPTGNVMNLNFDGITIGYSLEELTGIEGMVARFCYGQGFESEWGNGEMFNNVETKDTHFAGFNFDLLNDGTNFLQTTIFTAQDIADGFKGIIAFPTEYGELFAPTLYKDMQKFPTFNFVTRYQPSTNIGDINLGGLVFSRKEENGVNWFVSGGWTQLKPNGNAGMFGGMGTDAVFQATLSADGSEVYMAPVAATESKTRNGYGLYAGVQVPAPMGKFGLEYNYGSKYYTPFVQNMDDAVGAKLATRGHVGEAYYIVEFNPRAFLKLSGIYYDFEYSGSGSPVGAPKKIDDIQDGTAYSLMPVVDKALDLNASLTLKF